MSDQADPNDSFSQLLEFRSWLEDRGLMVAPTRIGHYLRRIEYFKAWPAEKTIPQEIWDEYTFLGREINELAWIYKGLAVSEPPGAVEILERVLSGPILSREEGGDTSARNFQLELRMASYFLQAGYGVDLSTESDLKVRMPSGVLYVECKRVSSERKISVRAKEALRQLRKRLKSHRGHTRPFGLPIFDVSRVLHPEQGVTSSKTNAQVRDGLRIQLLELCEKMKPAEIFGIDKDILAVWVQLTTPCWSESGPSSRMTSICTRLAPIVGPRAQGFTDFSKAFEVEGFAGFVRKQFDSSRPPISFR